MEQERKDVCNKYQEKRFVFTASFAAYSYSSTNNYRSLFALLLLLRIMLAMPEITSGKIRIVTAASLFDGHDAAINIMRRIMQSKGAEIIHLGHNRSVHEIVE